jgi:transposase-like protein
MAHTTLIRPVQRYVLEFEKRWPQLARAVGPSWRVDEKVRSKSCYPCCAVDRWSRFAKSCIIETATVGNSRTMRINGPFGMRSAIR